MKPAVLRKNYPPVFFYKYLRLNETAGSVFDLIKSWDILNFFK